METLSEHRISAAAPAVFIIVVAFQFLSKWLEQLKKRGPVTAEETRLRREIKQLSKEASSLSQPATFAQAAKLRRMATAKEKELAKRTVCKLSHSFRFMCFGALLWVDRF